MLVPCENFFRKPSEAYAEQKCSASTETDRRAEFSEQKQLHQHLCKRGVDHLLPFMN
jgi:hypothetical protein